MVLASQCKLYRGLSGLSIPPNAWTFLTFEKVLHDDLGMQRDLSLIVPPSDGYFIWSRNVRWESLTIPEGDNRPRQFMTRFARVLPDGSVDDTGADDAADTPGRDWDTVTWQFYGDSEKPVGVQVWHDHHVPAVVGHAQFVGTSLNY